MVSGILQTIALLAAGLMVGNELSVSWFLHPTLHRLPDDVHVPARRAFAKLFGRVMPFWYAAVLLLSIAVAGVGPSFRSTPGRLLLTATVLWLVAIVYTVIFPAPLNARIAAWNLQDLPASWRTDCQRWDRLHGIRMVILMAALVCQVVGVLISGW
jgi:uncharacterized membrane protein